MKQSLNLSNTTRPVHAAGTDNTADSAGVEAVLYREIFRFLSTHNVDGRAVMATATDLPRPLARSLVHFYELIKSETLSAVTVDLADQIAASLGRWFTQLWFQLFDNVAIDDDEDGLTDVILERPSVLVALLRRRWPEGSHEWERGLVALNATTDRSVYASIVKKLLEHREKLKIARRNLQLERALRLVTTPLADHLNDTMPAVIQTEEKLNNVFRRPGRWDIFRNDWRDVPWADFETLTPYVDEDDDLSALAHRLVKGVDPLSEQKIWRKRLDSRITTIELENGFGETVGLTRSHSPVLALPSELSLLAYPESEDLFFHRLAESGITSIDMQRSRLLHVREQFEHWDYVTAPQRLGPIIVCMDTSGSMQGEQGTIAATAALSLVREALQRGRQIDVIAVHDSLHVASFLAGPDCLPGEELLRAGEPIRIDPEPVMELRKIIAPAGLSGADVSPALEEALQRVESRSDSGEDTTDIIVVSDIHFPKVGPDHRNRMYRLQSRGWVRIHALTIGRNPIEDPLNVFDYRWHYNTAEELDFRVAGQSRRIGITGPGI